MGGNRIEAEKYRTSTGMKIEAHDEPRQLEKMRAESEN
jgi:hypothetical protein